jgi:uncharacterized membrane protein
MIGSLVVLTVLEASALLFVGLGIPLLRRRVRPNWIYGFRTPATLRNEELWYEVNAKTGADMVVVGAVLIVLAPVLYAACDSLEVFALVCVAWLLAGTFFMAAHGFMLIHEHSRTRGY